MTDPEFAPHLEALRRCGRAGFQFMRVPDALYAFRDSSGAMDVLLIRDTIDACAARYRVDDLLRYPRPTALWGMTGTVVDVVTEVLDLPRHGTQGAPDLACVATDIWVPR